MDAERAIRIGFRVIILAEFVLCKGFRVVLCGIRQVRRRIQTDERGVHHAQIIELAYQRRHDVLELAVFQFPDEPLKRPVGRQRLGNVKTAVMRLFTRFSTFCSWLYNKKWEVLVIKRILFSCLGTTDPVRGEHDGPMLHILRHYRPESAVLILTPEISELAEKDGRFEKTREWIAKHWGDYRPEFRYHKIDVRNAHDMDALDQPLRDAMAALSAEEPDAEILVNVTSGTPQMQLILSQMAMDVRYRTQGVQVKNFEKKSGTSDRTNRKDYDVDLELLCNEDESEGAENRCVEPRMYAISREYMRRQICSLLDARDFEAVGRMQEHLPENLRDLALHLAARSRLQDGEARRLAGQIKELPFALYPYRTGSRGAYSQVCEYYLLMKNQVRAENFTEFLLHLEPLTLTLQNAVLDIQLQRAGHSRTEFFYVDQKGREWFSPDSLQSAYPELFARYAANVPEVKPVQTNTYLLDVLLAFFSETPEQARHLFAHYGQLKDLRNQLAHTLCAATDAEIKSACGVDAAALLRELEATMISCYPACDPSIFNVYDKSIAYIKERL